MTRFHTIYVACWSTALLAAVILAVHERRQLELFDIEYWRFLGKRWKVVTFIAAFVGINGLAPISGVPTWDFVTASFMAAFAYTTAPWSIGTLIRQLSGRMVVSWSHLWVAVIVWLFSASWSYDLYLLLRDGTYPVTWTANLVASSTLYLGAGTFWSLDWNESDGIHLAFMTENWPSSDGADFANISRYAVPLLVVVGLLFLMFPLFHFTGWGP